MLGHIEAQRFHVSCDFSTFVFGLSTDHSLSLPLHCRQVLILTHEDEQDAKVFIPHIEHYVRPVRPLVLFGRSFRAEPECGKKESVWYGWRDRL